MDFHCLNLTNSYCCIAKRKSCIHIEESLQSVDNCKNNILGFLGFIVVYICDLTIKPSEELDGGT